LLSLACWLKVIQLSGGFKYKLVNNKFADKNTNIIEKLEEMFQHKFIFLSFTKIPSIFLQFIIFIPQFRILVARLFSDLEKNKRNHKNVSVRLPHKQRVYGWSAKKVSGSVPSKSELTILIVFSFHTDHIFMRISAKERKKGGGDVELSLSDKKIIDPVIIFF
jgi:hypothetical protein